MRGIFRRVIMQLALHKRKAVMLSAVAFVHLVVIGMFFFRTVTSIQAVDNASTLVVMLRSGIVPQHDPEARQKESVPPEVRPAVPKQQADPENLSSPPDLIRHRAPANKGEADSIRKPVISEPKPQSSALSRPDTDQKQASHGGQDALSSSFKRNLPFKPALPPSSKLLYSTKSGGLLMESIGSGTILWQVAGNNFSISGEFNSQNANGLYFASEGMIDQNSGLRPDVYVEKWGNESPTNTHFRRDQNEIRFVSSSTSSAETKGSNGTELDPVSAIWLLVNAGRADGQAFTPGASFDMQVAGAKSLEVWQVQVVGEEEIDTVIGKLKAWHLARTPESGDVRGVEVWLAPEKDWWPVKMRYSGPDGSQMEMLIVEIVPTPDR